MEENMNNNFNENNGITPPEVAPVIPGRGKAIASLVLGILAIICWFFTISCILSVILGIIGLILASSAKKEGFTGGLRTGGFVTSLIGLIGGGIIIVACVACIGVTGAAIASGDVDINEIMNQIEAYR